MRNVVFIQNKMPSSGKEFIELMERWGRYQSLFKHHTGGNTFSVFTIKNLTKERKNLLQNFLVYEFVEHMPNPFLRFLMAWRKISNLPNETILICGDNQLSFVVAILLKSLMPRKVLIQTQFHGDTYTLSSNKGISGKLRVLLSIFAIRFSDSIRVVSEFQIKEIERFCGKHKVNFVVAPIPIDFRRIPEVAKVRDIDILFVGRFHHERGIKELVNILNSVLESNNYLRINLVGIGPLKNYVANQLEFNENSNNITFSGYLSFEQLRDIYSRSKVLISSAPKEGYGLTLREAALSGVYVVARLSNGSMEASKDFPHQLITYESQEEAVRLILDAISNTTSEIFPETKIKQINRDLFRLHSLFDSWENLNL